MTLIGAILKRAKSHDSISSKLSKRLISPPPELQEIEEIEIKQRKIHVDKFKHVKAIVDTSPPLYHPHILGPLAENSYNAFRLRTDNVAIIIRLHDAMRSGKVDNKWEALPPPVRQYCETRCHFRMQTDRLNRQLQKLVTAATPRVETAESHARFWSQNRREMTKRAQNSGFKIPPKKTVDEAFIAAPGVRRPRVYLTLHVVGASSLGSLAVELFTDICPGTCRLFLELAAGDGVGHGYIGTRFFTKVPHLFWSGGDVTYDNGFGCYAQKGRCCPIAAENYHFSHSMPGLLSMRATKDNEMCGMFNITFKPLHQFDLHSVVFGRIVLPCSTYEVISNLGQPLSTRPHVVISATRYKSAGSWVHGVKNTRLVPAQVMRCGRPRR